MHEQNAKVIQELADSPEVGDAMPAYTRTQLKDLLAERIKIFTDSLPGPDTTQASHDELDKPALVEAQDDTCPVVAYRPIEHDSPSPCQSCVGWCCYRFNISVGIKDGKIDWERERGRADPGDVDFMQANFMPVRKLPRLDGYSWENDRKVVTFACKEYDMDAGKCTAYDRRPQLCRRYLCSTAEKGGTPSKLSDPNVRVQAGVMKRCGLDPAELMKRAKASAEKANVG